jgi:lipopolysaccharide transport system permease protein
MQLPMDTTAASTAAPARHPVEELPERVIAPAKRRLKLRDLYRQHAIIRILAARDLKTKYKQAVLGPLWLVFQPAALLLGFVVAFRSLGNVQSAHVPYAVFALAGLSTWAYFQAALTIGTNTIINNSAFVRYTPCPRLAFPVASLIASLPTFAITAIGAVASAAATGFLSPRVLLIPIGLVWLLILTAGFVAISASVAVRFRDVISALPFLLQLGTFLAPVGFSLSSLSPTVRTLVEINPVTGLIETIRWMMISGYHPATTAIVISVCLTAVLALTGWLVFARAETTMADVI